MNAPSPIPYSDAWSRLPIAYVAQVAAALADAVVWWNDPVDPRDATIRLADGSALVWDEESGWRHGRFVSGSQGVRTELAGVRYLGGGVLPEPARVGRLLAAARSGRSGGAHRPVYRSYRDHGDGLDGALAAYADRLAAL